MTKKRLTGLGIALLLSVVSLGLYTFQPASPAGTAVAPGGGVEAPGEGPAGQVAGNVPSPSEPLRGTGSLLHYVPVGGPASAVEVPLGARFLRQAVVDPEFALGKQSPLWKPDGRFALAMPDGREVQVRVRSAQMLDVSRFVVEGELEGQADSRFILTGAGGRQYSMEVLESAPVVREGVRVTGPRMTVMAPTGAPEMLVYEVDPYAAPYCGGIHKPSEEILAKARHRAALAALDDTTTKPQVRDANSVSIEVETTDRVLAESVLQIDVAFFYSQAVVNNLAGPVEERLAAVQSRVDTIVASTNSDFSRSEIYLKIRAVGLEQVTYDESATSSSEVNETALERVALTDDGYLDQVHTRRDQLGADMVCLMLDRTDLSSIGIAYMLDTPSVKSTSGSILNDIFAFSVVTYRYTTGYNLVSHELGHNFGAQHDRAAATTDTGVVQEGAFPFSFGYHFSTIDGLQRTIMAYAPGLRTSYFSNPDLTPAAFGVRIGVPETEGNPCNNAKTLNMVGFEVSQYRHQVTDPVARGTMVNVSTRAFVGVGAQQLTAGFVIVGEQPKEVLIRAVGPSLAQFPNLKDLLSDPWIEITAVPSLMVQGTVDDWQNEANAARISSFTSSIGAFSLISPKDAAKMITLPPGMYTAKVEGVGGLTGLGLVEVYETDLVSNSRLVNVSTRAYATVLQPLVGGFVINGNPGETKRVLIRAQGPSLPPEVSGPMYDPTFEVHRAGANPKLLVACDDWTYSLGATSDASPTATYYDEVAISNSGFAPKNRREPAVILDLEPGLYTVTVRPFAAPEKGQPEQPGVALVEVFELQQ